MAAAAVAYGIYLAAGDDCQVNGNQISGLSSWDSDIVYAINIAAGNANRIRNNTVRECLWYGNYSASGVILVAAGTNGIVANNTTIDVGNLMKFGYCESATPPTVLGDSADFNSNCTFGVFRRPT